VVNIQQYIERSFRESIELKEAALGACRAQIEQVVALISECYRKEGKVLICGNGGSAADAQHLATELMIQLSHNIKRRSLGAISLCTDCSNLTAGGNDIGFENVFARNVEGLGRSGDVLMGISTSGNSINVIRAMEKAKDLKMKVVGILGNDGGRMKLLCDVSIIVPSSNIQRIQECHILIGHIICELVELTLFSS
jgi:D-sedoheptulose 7-phosphate isomerase